MGEFYIRQPDELYHYGVKGMKWGVRHDPQPSSARSSMLAGVYAATGSERVGRALDKSNDRDAARQKKAIQRRESSKKKMSTAKKVAIGVGVAAAVAGVSYVAVKSHKTSVYNKAARAAVQKAIVSANKAGSAYEPGMNLYKESVGHYKLRAGRGARGYSIGMAPSKFKPSHGSIHRSVKLTGHSGRVTKAGAARHRSEYYFKKAANEPITGDYMTNASNKRRQFEAKAASARDEALDQYKYSRVVKFNNYGSVNKLKRKKR